MRIHEATDILYSAEELEERALQERLYRYSLAHNLLHI